MIFLHLETSDVIYCSDRFSELSLNMLVAWSYCQRGEVCEGVSEEGGKGKRGKEERGKGSEGNMGT